MSQFDKDKIEVFLGAVRKYMQVRGPMSQKELAEITDTGVSTMSRFLNQQTKEMNANLIAHITAKLTIPLHEIIDFVEEAYTDQFIRLVKFYKGEEAPEVTVTPEAIDGGSEKSFKASVGVGRKKTTLVFQADQEGDQNLKSKLQDLSLKQKGFLNEFLNLDSDGKDLVADVGRNIITYLRQKGIDF
jgi:transcriptional regulator with XRE-family HTH domain